MREKLPDYKNYCTVEGELGDWNTDEMNAICYMPPTNRWSKQLSPA